MKRHISGQSEATLNSEEIKPVAIASVQYKGKIYSDKMANQKLS